MSSAERKKKAKAPGIQPYSKGNLNARQKWQKYGKPSPDKKKTFYESMKEKIWGNDAEKEAQSPRKMFVSSPRKTDATANDSVSFPYGTKDHQKMFQQQQVKRPGAT